MFNVFRNLERIFLIKCAFKVNNIFEKKSAIFFLCLKRKAKAKVKHKSQIMFKKYLAIKHKSFIVFFK